MPIKPELTPEQKAFRREFGARLRHVRETELEITAGEMSERLGMSPTWVSSLERALYGVDVMYLADIARVTGVPASYFLTGKMPAPEAPTTLMAWQALYPDEPTRARVHWDVDQAYRQVREGNA